MKNNTKIRKQQRGFALIEVLMAALILTVGGAAFMKLQGMGLQYNYNNYARTQGMAIARGLVEQLRSNIAYAKSTDLNAQIKSTVTDYEPTSTIDCSGSAATCATNVFKHQEYLISQQIAEVSPNSVLCYREHASTEGYVRVTYLWQDNSEEGKTTNITDCPAFDATTNLSNSVTIYAQL